MIPSVELRSGFTMPQLGFGTWTLTQTGPFQQAYDLGYRHFDSATMYGNEQALGQVLRQYDRGQLFLTSKLLPDSEMGGAAVRACERMLSRLGMDYLDLLLIHWPGGGRAVRQETWRAMEELVHSGKVRSLGVSNFLEPHLSDIEAVATVPISVNQVEYHPLCQNESLVRYCASKGIIVEAYSPFGAGLSDIFQNAKLREIAGKHSKTVAQVTLKWLLQQGIVPLPRSKNTHRMRENLEVFDFTLTEADMQQIASLNVDNHTDWDPRSVR